MDLAWTQPVWNNFFQRIGLISSVYHTLDRFRDELKRDDIIVDEYYDANEYLTNWALSGVNLFTNTDEKGLLYVSIVPNNGNWDVNIWMDALRGSLVAKATAVAAGATGTLVEQNSSGLSGTVDLSAGIGADATIWLRPRCGLLQQIGNVPINDTFDSFLKADLMSILTNVVDGIATALSKSESFAKRYMIDWIGNKIGSQESTYSTPTETPSGGTISYENEGMLRDLIDAMEDDTNAGAQSIESPAIGSISESADVDNVGAGTVGTPTWFEYAEECIVTLECIVETIGSEAFSVVAKRSKEGTIMTAQNNLTVTKTYVSTDIGIKSMTLIRTITDSGDEANHFSDWAFSGETSVNTDDGVLYCGYVSGTKILSIYSDSGRSELVAQGTWDGVDGSTCVLVEQNSSGLSGSVKISQVGAVDPLTTNTLEVDLNVFKEEDRIYLTYTRAALSFLELFFGRLFKTELPFDNLGAHTIEDDYGNRGYSGLGTEEVVAVGP